MAASVPPVAETPRSLTYLLQGEDSSLPVLEQIEHALTDRLNLTEDLQDKLDSRQVPRNQRSKANRLQSQIDEKEAALRDSHQTLAATNISVRVRAAVEQDVKAFTDELSGLRAQLEALLPPADPDDVENLRRLNEEIELLELARDEEQRQAAEAERDSMALKQLIVQATKEAVGQAFPDTVPDHWREFFAGLVEGVGEDVSRTLTRIESTLEAMAKTSPQSAGATATNPVKVLEVSPNAVIVSGIVALILAVVCGALYWGTGHGVEGGITAFLLVLVIGSNQTYGLLKHFMHKETVVTSPTPDQTAPATPAQAPGAAPPTT